MPKLSLPNTNTDSTLKDLMVHADHIDFLTHETDQVGALEELGENTTPVVDEENDIDVEMVIEEKALRENVSVSEETMLVSDEVIEEKALGEKAASEENDVWKEEEVKGSCVVSSECEGKEEGDVYCYTWAAKYQPKTLEDFICNRDTAYQLKTMVRYIYLYLNTFIF